MTSFFIQNHQFDLPDLSIQADQFVVNSYPRPYPVHFTGSIVTDLLGLKIEFPKKHRLFSL